MKLERTIVVEESKEKVGVWLSAKEAMQKVGDLHDWLMENFNEPVEAIGFLRCALRIFEEHYGITFETMEVKEVGKA